jgi:protease-4
MQQQQSSAVGAPPGWPPVPPPMMMPPPMFYPAPPPRRGGLGRAVFTTLALVVFSFSLILNVYLLLVSGVASLASSDAGTVSSVITSGDNSQKIAVIPIDDVIDTPLRDRFERAIKQIENDKSVKAVVLEIDTPGGTVTASDEIYSRILKLKAQRNIPVVTAMGGLATSGGYYVACASDEIFVQPTTLTGNIGVIMQRFNYSGAMEKVGVADASVTPEGAKFKDLGSPYKPETPEGTTYLRGFAEDFYRQFKAIVEKGRAGKLKDKIDRIADGRVFTATDALKLGLADTQGYAHDAYDRAAKLAGLSNPTVVRYKHQPSLFEALNIKWTGGGASGVNLSIDPKVLHQLTTPRAMYIWRGE